MRASFALLIAIAVLGCPKPDPSVPDAALEVDAGLADAGLEPVDAGPPELRYTLTFEAADGGETEFDQGTKAGIELEPVKALRFVFPAPLDDVRFRVMDWTDAVVPSDDEAASPADAGYEYRIVLTQPLKTGRSYSILIDSESHDTFSDVHGNAYDELRLSLKIRGEIQPEPGASPKKKKRKK